MGISKSVIKLAALAALLMLWVTNAHAVVNVHLTWSDVARSEDGYIIERNANGGLFSEINRVGANVTTYTDNGLDPTVVYCYRIASYKGVAESGRSPSTCTRSVGQGSILVERQGEATQNRLASAPWAETWIDSGTHTTNNDSLTSGLSTGSHAVRSTDVIGLNETAGTCSYPIGGTACTVTTFDQTPSCDRTSCTLNVNVVPDNVTKVAFRYTGVYEGYAAAVVGGQSGTIAHVTNLNTSGAGSFIQVLQDACANHNTYIVFDVSGTINTTASHVICGHYITIDGFTSPGGILLTRSTLRLQMTHPVTSVDEDTHDIIIRGLTVEKMGNADVDNAGINFDIGSTYQGSGPNRLHHLVIDSNTFSGGTDDQFNIGRESHDFTVSNNAVYGAQASHQNMITIGFNYNFTFFNNFLGPESWRNALIKHYSEEGAVDATNLTADFRNNLVFVGNVAPDNALEMTNVTTRAKANIVNNYYLGSSTLGPTPGGGVERAIVICVSAATSLTGKGVGWRHCGGTFTSGGGGTVSDDGTQAGGAWVAGNVVNSDYPPVPTWDVNSLSYRTASAFSAPVITGQVSAASAACRVLAQAGRRPASTGLQAYLTAATTELAKFETCP